MKKLSLLILSTCLFSTLNLSAKEDYSLKFDKDTRGVVRKMLVYKNPMWVSKIVTNDERELFFISPKSMLEFYYKPKNWPETKINNSSELKELIVTDYTTGEAIDAKYAFYVYGSNKISFAGDDLPAFKNIENAKNFSKANRGMRILSFKEISSGLIQLLNGDI
ncbi:MAG: hypothetical protein C0625_02825 [Arcobacter sp.]|nr:MAG: hypothetical protein C0625_02825 [Arcobacter sp.]